MNPQAPSPEPKAKTGPLIFTVVMLSVLLASAAAFGFWAFISRGDYKNNVDKKITVAVDAAKKAQAADLQQQYEKGAKAPLKSYKGSTTYGSVTFNYPKAWSAYVDESSSSEPINAYFHPNQVPGLQSNTAYALRLELLSTAYSQVLQQFSSQITSGAVKAVAYVPPKMKGVANVQPGIRLDGAIARNQQGAQNGAMILIKARDKTLQIYTQSTNYLTEFNNIVLPSLSFVP